jgi:N-acetylmuramic acid 6-phosphate etherase
MIFRNHPQLQEKRMRKRDGSKGSLDIRNELERLLSEKRNLDTRDLSKLSVATIVRMINREDEKVAKAVRKEIPKIVRAVNSIISALKRDGRLFYIGAGTSGRLAVIDAAELLPTFGVGGDIVQAIIAGGPRAMFRPVEGAEDDARAGAKALRQRNFCKRDVVVGISASGRTPFVVGALEYARERVGSKSIALTVNPDSPIWKKADITICPNTGPEILTGSTRMKAGTAQKMVLNILSTASMTKLGKVYGNLMVDLRPFSKKLVERARRIVVAETGLGYYEAQKLLGETRMNVKLAILIAKSGQSLNEGQKLLAKSHGSLDRALQRFQKGETK